MRVFVPFLTQFLLASCCVARQRERRLRQAWQGENGRSATLPYWYLREIFIQKPEVIFDDVVTNMSNQSVVKRGDVDNIIFTI